MANSLRGSSRTISSSPIKLVLVSLSVALFLALISKDEYLSKIPLQIRTFVVSLLRPPYIYALINSIIFTLIAITKFQQCFVNRTDKGKPVVAPLEIRPEFEFGYNRVYNVMGSEYCTSIYQEKADDVVGDKELEAAGSKSALGLAFTADNSGKMTGYDELMIMPAETSKLGVSERIGRPGDVKSSVEGTDTMALAPTKPKQPNTLESTWMKLPESHTMPVTRHQKKQEASETHNHVHDHDHVRVMKKHETFSNLTTTNFTKDRSAQPGQLMWEDRSLWKLRKEPSLSQEELNRRVEAFIKKFNEDMRLQRQESLKRHLEIVNSVAG